MQVSNVRSAAQTCRAVSHMGRKTVASTSQATSIGQEARWATFNLYAAVRRGCSPLGNVCPQPLSPVVQQHLRVGAGDVQLGGRGLDAALHAKVKSNSLCRARCTAAISRSHILRRSKHSCPGDPAKSVQVRCQQAVPRLSPRLRRLHHWLRRFPASDRWRPTIIRFYSPTCFRCCDSST